MTDHDRSGDAGTVRNGGAPGKDSVATLIRLAGPRPVIPEDVQQRVHAAVHREWQGSCQRRRTLRWGIPFTLAAAAAAAVVLIDRTPEVPVAPIATVVRVAEGAAAGTGDFLPGEAVYPGSPLSTGERGVALALSNGLSVRLDAGTTVTFASVKAVTLDTGRLYADSGPSIYDHHSIAGSITVNTPVGSATDVGTQFAVSLAGGDMRIAVREGSVNVAAGASAWTAQAGDLLTVAADDVRFDRVSKYDSSWDWAASLAPAFDLENRSVLDFLKWVARETGRELVFENDEARFAAMRTRLHGGMIDDLTPMEAVDAVLPTTRFEFRVRVEDRRILIGAPSP